MVIIPAINCQEFEQVRDQFALAQEILFGNESENHETGDREGWLHIDIADGGFTNGHATWRSAQELPQLKRHPLLKIELHVMMNEPEQVIPAWLAAGVNRIIFHYETTQDVVRVITLCQEAGAQAMLALRPETPVSVVKPYVSALDGLQILAVIPGLSGQVMQDGVLEKLAQARKLKPEMTLEVDGAVNEKTVGAYVQAGASQAVSSSYIFGADNPALAYAQLARLGESAVY